VFGAKTPAISATKSLTGHSQGAAGVHEAIYTLLMMQNDFICESANIVDLDPAVEGANIVRRRIDNANINVACPTVLDLAAPTPRWSFQRYEK
jgi:3-oxoacyl-[acyl-carrier-protein] synthase-1